MQAAPVIHPMDKKTIEKHEKILNELVQQEENKYCADCGEKGTRWASWNIGVFLCIRCGGLHRRLGTHISRVKSVNLDSWTSEQVEVSFFLPFRAFNQKETRE